MHGKVILMILSVDCSKTVSRISSKVQGRDMILNLHTSIKWYRIKTGKMLLACKGIEKFLHYFPFERIFRIYFKEKLQSIFYVGTNLFRFLFY